MNENAGSVLNGNQHFSKIGGPGVKVDEEKTGYGWKTEALIEAKDIIPQMKCSMERPQK